MIEKLTRRQIRYLCFRLQTEQSGGDSTSDLQFANQLKNILEKQKNFDGWNKFTQSWDVSKKNPLICVKLNESKEEIWDNMILENSRELK